jgi:hypothetical protein
MLFLAIGCEIADTNRFVVASISNISITLQQPESKSSLTSECLFMLVKTVDMATKSPY